MPMLATNPGPLSVVLPTRDRPAILARTLASLVALRGEVAALDIVVVDDGSSLPIDVPATPGDPSFELRLSRSPAAGPAAARNHGIASARFERLLLLGDDTRPAPGCLARHARAAEGLQGRIDWDPEQTVSPVMNFLAPAGPQFWFQGLVDGGAVPFSAVLGANYSAPRSWFLAEPFDEGFPDAAFEDTELAWRFRARGFRTRYAADAICLHSHTYATIEPFLERQQRAGRAARYAVGRHTALAWWVIIRPLALEIARTAGLGAPAPPAREWDRLCRRAYLQGFFATPSPPAPAYRP
ncbi:MAG: glycosyltransferase [Thermoanaerobaculia bacterium]